MMCKIEGGLITKVSCPPPKIVMHSNYTSCLNEACSSDSPIAAVGGLVRDILHDEPCIACKFRGGLPSTCYDVFLSKLSRLRSS